MYPLTMKLKLLNPASRASLCGRLFTALFAMLCLASAPVFANPIPADRLPAGGWKPGIPGGIPDTSTWRVINVRQSIPGTNLVAKADGVTPDQAALQAAVNYAVLNPKTVIYLPAGVYRMTAGIVAKSPSGWGNLTFVIRGDGMGRTQIVGDGVNGTLIQMLTYWDLSRSASIVSGATAGSKTITVNDWSLFRDFIYTDTPVMIAQDNDLTAYPNTPDYMKYTIAEKINPVSWSSSAKTVTLSRPLMVNYNMAKNVKVWLSRSIPYRSGIENLTIRSTNHIKGTQHHVLIYGGNQCWMKGVESVGVAKWNIRLYGCVQTEITQCYLNESRYGGGDQGYGVGLYSQCTDNYVYDNIARKLRHSYITEYGGVGNVFAYNYSIDPKNENANSTDFLMIDAATMAATRSSTCGRGTSSPKWGRTTSSAARATTPSSATTPPAVACPSRLSACGRSTLNETASATILSPTCSIRSGPAGPTVTTSPTICGSLS
jgi:hypothetical protein